MITNNAIHEDKLTTWVNPFIGTGAHGHTYPGATMPFGMMQLSPDTRLDGWDGCSGYHYTDKYIYGFSHTHLSGTGVSDYGDILLMPTTSIQFDNGSSSKSGYKAPFDHKNEIAEPGYYSVILDSIQVQVELTVSKRSGIHKYQYLKAENQYLVIDLEHRDFLLDAKIEYDGKQSISGYRHSKAWAEKQQLYYYLTFSHTIQDIHFNKKKNPTKAVIEFYNPQNTPILTKVGISAVDEDGAKKNCEIELQEESFLSIKKKAEEEWESQLQKIKIQSSDNDKKTIFYSALYHTMIAPNIYQDVDGRYRGMDHKIHQTNDFDYYTVFSLWDTYRATHPLYTIIEQKRTNDFINTFLAKHQEGGIMPIWDLSACYTGCMIGYHAVPVIADAYNKGIQDYDNTLALQAMIHSASQEHLGLESYKKLGFIPVEKESESVSKTLEYAYDDWCIAQMAKKMGKTDIYREYIQRAQYYKNVFDPETQFMRGKIRNQWFSPFDPYEVNFNYTEANAWQYSYYVPQDIDGYIELMGSKKAMEKHLDRLFEAKSEIAGRHQVDITGLIGQYAHGNEPSHHMAYLYNYVNKPHKTQEKVHQILTELYTSQPDGISGNEDCGQMSAWYIFSSLGFYPVTPGSTDYIIGTPIFPKSTIQLENGKTFTILAHDVSDTNKYIKNVKLNGKNYPYSYLKHEDIIKGGVIEFEMTDTASSWGTSDTSLPHSQINEYKIVPVPYIKQGKIAFKERTECTLDHVNKNATIYYSLNNEKYQKYESPFEITEETLLKMYAQLEITKSQMVQTQFYKVDPNLTIELLNEYANQYSAGGNDALIDGMHGGIDFRSGSWQGYYDTDFGAIIDLGSIKTPKVLTLQFLEDQKPWIFLPSEITVSISSDGKTYQTVESLPISNTSPSDKATIRHFELPINQACQYIRIEAKTLGTLPEWHLGYTHKGKSWIFVDEIVVEY